jgi:hypothetical protein
MRVTSFFGKTNKKELTVLKIVKYSLNYSGSNFSEFKYDKLRLTNLI